MEYYQEAYAGFETMKRKSRTDMVHQSSHGDCGSNMVRFSAHFPIKEGSYDNLQYKSGNRLGLGIVEYAQAYRAGILSLDLASKFIFTDDFGRQYPAFNGQYRLLS